MDEWRELTAHCIHCGGLLEGRPKHIPGCKVTVGCEPMEYRHAESHKKECYTRHEARPYTDWGQYDEYRGEPSYVDNND